MRRLLLLLLLALCASTPLWAELPTSATLTLLPATTLPALPVSFLVTITNSSATAQRVAEFAALDVSTNTGYFRAVGLRGDSSIHLPSEQLERCNGGYCLTIPPNGQRQLYLHFGPLLAGNEFFVDRRLSKPGRYALELTLYLISGDALIPIRTDVQTLLIQEPSGVDLEAWHFLQGLGDGTTWSATDWIFNGEKIAPKLRETYPASSYVPWVAAIGSIPRASPATEISQLDSALALNVPAALRDELLFAKGGLLSGLSHSALFAERDADKALALADQARVPLAQLQQVAVTEYSRNAATAEIAKLLTPKIASADLQTLAEHDPPAPAKLIPRVECVTRGAGQSFSARFGYVNPNKVIKVLQIGSNNEVTPAPRDAGQPRVFRPGANANVFTATSPGGVLKWHLDNDTAVATPDLAPCSQ